MDPTELTLSDVHVGASCNETTNKAKDYPVAVSRFPFKTKENDSPVAGQPQQDEDGDFVVSRSAEAHFTDVVLIGEAFSVGNSLEFVVGCLSNNS